MQLDNTCGLSGHSLQNVSFPKPDPWVGTNVDWGILFFSFKMCSNLKSYPYGTWKYPEIKIINMFLKSWVDTFFL